MSKPLMGAMAEAEVNYVAHLLLARIFGVGSISLPLALTMLIATMLGPMLSRAVNSNISARLPRPHERCGTYRRIFSNTTTQRCGAVAFGSARRNDEIVTNYAFGHALTLAVAEKRARDYCRIGMRNAGIHETISATVCEVPDRGSKCNDPLF